MKDNMDFFISKLRESGYTDFEIDDILNGLLCDKKATFRINRLKTNITKVTELLDSLSIEFKFDNECEDAIILQNYNDKKDFDTKTGLSVRDFDMYKSGKIYFQNVSSMMPVYLLNPKPNENILDMCAAPGGKTTMIQSLTNNKSYLTAVELHTDRFEKLKHNCKLQGANAYLINSNANDLDNNLKFDKILLDAPCSGSGIIDLNDNKKIEGFTDTLINKCVSTQKKLLKKAYKLLKKGGELVYSTCSLLKIENEDMVKFAVENGYSLYDESKPFIKIMPDEIREGFFMAKFKKL